MARAQWRTDARLGGIRKFVADCCVVGAEHEVMCGILWSAWKAWCERHSRPIGVKQWFGRELAAAMPEVCVIQRTMSAIRVRCYAGIKLR